MAVNAHIHLRHFLLPLAAGCLPFLLPSIPTSADEGAPTGICINTENEAETCSDYSGGGYSNTPSYRAPSITPQELQRRREAAAREARHRRAVELNDLAVFRTTDWAKKIKLYQQALDLWPENKQFQQNLSVARAQLENSEGIRLFDKGDYKDAIENFKRALQYGSKIPKFMLAKTYHANIAYAEASIAYESHQYSQAIAKLREAINYDSNDERLNTLREWQREADAATQEAANRVAVQGQVSNLIENLQHPLAASSVGQNSPTESKLDFLQITPRAGAQNCPFEKCGNPAKPKLTASTNAPPISNSNSAAQADSNSKTGQIAATAPDSETAKDLADHGFGKEPIIRGDPLAVLVPQGKPRGSAGLSGEQIRALLNDKDGLQLFNEERRLQEQLNETQKKVRDIEDKLKNASPQDRAKIAVDVSKIRTERDLISNQLIDTQRKVEEKIKYVLDPTEKDTDAVGKNGGSTQPKKQQN